MGGVDFTGIYMLYSFNYQMVSRLPGSIEKQSQEALFSPFVKLPFLAFLVVFTCM